MSKLLFFKKSKADYFGIVGSALCAVHCAFTPFIVAAISAVKSAEGNWEWLDYGFIGLCLWAVFHSAKHTRSRAIKYGLWAAWAVFSVGILFEDAFEGMNYVGYVGSFGLVVLHILNIKYFKHCENCQH